MAQRDDHFIAARAIEVGNITREQLLDAVLSMSGDWLRGGSPRTLGCVLVQKGYLAQTDLDELILSAHRSFCGEMERPKKEVDVLGPMPTSIPEEPTRMESLRIGQLLILAGAVTPNQLMEALITQEESRDEEGQSRMRIGEYLVATGYTTVHAIQRALSYRGKAIYWCRRCRKYFNVVNPGVRQVYRCNYCWEELLYGPENVKANESITVELFAGAGEPATVSFPGMKVPGPLAHQDLLTDRAAKLFLQRRDLVAEPTLRDAEYMQLEVEEFGMYVPLLDVLVRIGALSEAQATGIRIAIASNSLKATMEVPGYRLLGRIASGSSFALYSAHADGGSAPLLFKILHPDLSSDAIQVARFRSDASLLMRFDHPGLIKIHECGCHPPDGREGGAVHYSILDAVSGRTLDRLRRASGRLAPSSAVSITMDIASALSYLQREGFVHGAVTPEGVLIDGANRAHLVDLSHASPYDRSAKTDPRIAEDVHALGVLLKSMLGGSMGHARSGEEPTAAIDLGFQSVPVQLLQTLQIMLDPEPSKRFQYFSDIVDRLRPMAEKT